MIFYLLLLCMHIFCAATDTYIIKNWNRSVNSVRQFRKMSDPVICQNNTGLAELRASGSAQFSPKGLSKVLKSINQPFTSIYIIDLRQESHGFLECADTVYPISWYTEYNSINWGKNYQQIRADEKYLCNSLQPPCTIFEASWIILPFTTLSTFDRCITEEELISEFPGVHYIRIPVPDEQAPTYQQVDELIHYIKTVPSDAWFHFHCAAGRGRTTTFLCLLDIFYNARSVSLVDIVTRQAQIGGVNLFGRFMSAFKSLRQRKKLIIDFYNYAQECSPLFTISFSEWTQKNKNS